MSRLRGIKQLLNELEVEQYEEIYDIITSQCRIIMTISPNLASYFLSIRNAEKGERNSNNSRK
jgi:hypothetical protein